MDKTSVYETEDVKVQVLCWVLYMNQTDILWSIFAGLNLVFWIGTLIWVHTGNKQ